MRKIIVLLLVLLAMAASAAFAEGEKAPGLFELYSADGNETVLLGAAVSPYEGILITAASVLPEHPEQLVISDGVNFWKAQAAAPDSAGICAMILYDVSEQKPSAGCCELYSGAVQPEDIALVLPAPTAEEGTATNAPAASPASLPMGGQQAAIRVEVSNNGLTTAEGYALSLYAADGDGETLIGEVESSVPLSPGAKRVHEFDYRLPENPDCLRFRADTRESRREGGYYPNVGT